MNAIAEAAVRYPAQDADLSHESGLPLSINELVGAAAADWRSQTTDFPDLGPPFSPREQHRRERRADQCRSAVDAAFRWLPRTTTGSPSAAAKITLSQITAEVVSFIPAALSLDDECSAPQLRSLLNDGLAEVGLDMARQARQLDPSVSIVDVLQAARNAWVACGLQVMLGKSMHLTPGIFAYSMLYPYSDNFLDEKTTTREDKLRFSERFERRLVGEHLPAMSRLEAIIWDLVGMIEDQYSRTDYPGVWASVLAIHHAQTRSIRQMSLGSSGDALSASETLNLTFNKGGTSVLADAYLAAGHLTALEAKVAFDWGVVLQLGDDLQDLHSDLDRASSTLFTGAAGFGRLDGVTNKTFHFSQSAMREVAALTTCPPVLKTLLERSARMFLIRSVAGADKFFSGDYSRRLETHSPFRFHFLKSRERRCYRRRHEYARLFEAVVQPGEAS